MCPDPGTWRVGGGNGADKRGMRSEKPRVPLLKRVLDVSSREVAAGGESGRWACLLPALVVHAVGEQHLRLNLTLGGGLLLAMLLMWVFWARRARAAVAERADEMEQELRYHAFHDGLTGLPNRALFEDRVAHALERLRRNGEA